MKVGEGSHETKRDRGKSEKCCQQKRAPVAQQAADISWTAVICDDVTNQLDAGRCVTRRFGRRRTALGGPPAGQRPSRTRSRRRSTVRAVDNNPSLSTGRIEGTSSQSILPCSVGC